MAILTTPRGSEQVKIGGLVVNDNQAPSIPTGRGWFLEEILSWLKAKFHQTTGHKHTGAAGDGPKLSGIAANVITASSGTDFTTTAVVGTAASVPAEPRLSVSLAAGDKVLLIGHAQAYCANDAPVYMQLMRSDDGGATWGFISTYSGAQVGAGSTRRVALAVAHVDAPSAGSYIYALSIGNAGGNAYSIAAQYRALTLIVVRG